MKKIGAWFSEWWGALAITAFVVIFVWAIGTSALSDRRSVPKTSCESQYTGQSRTYPVAQTICVGFDKNGTCTTPIVQYYDVTEHEIRTICDFKEWQ